MKIYRRLWIVALIALLMLPQAASAFWFWNTPATEASGDALATPMPTAEPTPMPTVAPTPAPTPVALTKAESALLRVRLSSLGAPQALGITVSGGEYAVDGDPGFRFDADAELAVSAEGGTLYLSCGGLTINMGGTFTLTRHQAADGAANGLVLHETERENLYVGDLRLAANQDTIEATLTIDVEDYLLGVVPYEMSDSFPLEALKAQAVAARTYALAKRAASAGKAYDVVDTTSDQVYRGMNADYANAARAAEETRGVVCMAGDKYITCFFSASNGGQTALPSQVWSGGTDPDYLDVRDDPYDLENPNSVVKRYTLPYDGGALESAMRDALIDGLTEQMAALGFSDERGDIRILHIVSAQPENPVYGEGNRMYQSLRVGVSVEGKRVYAVTPDATPNAETTPANLVETLPEPLYVSLDFYGKLKALCDLKINSTAVELLSVSEEADGFVLESRRFGHGIGMSQRGAQRMAGKYDMDYLRILAFYYPGATLARVEFEREEISALSAKPVSLGYARPRPTPRPTPAPLPALSAGEYYAVVTLDSGSSALNVREKPDTSGALRGTLLKGQRVIVIRETGTGWALVKTAELTGYSSMDYLTRA